MFRQLSLFICLTLLASALTNSTSAQQLSPTASISLLTCGSGNELYSTFGHSALRVCDTAQQFDMAFNYGTFDFSDPNFYSNFVRGKLRYKLSVYPFDSFMMEYTMDERWVKEQQLNLTAEQRQALFEFLVNNSRPENAYYLYEFLFDNCSSRIRDVLEKVFPGQVKFSESYMEGKPSFRNLLHGCLNSMPWTKLGIDILLGKRVDREMTPREYMFLPNYLYGAFEHATLNGQPLVSKQMLIFQPAKTVNLHINIFSPLAVLCLLFILVLVCSILKFPLRGFDFVLFFIVGALGVFLVFMWVGTEHYVTKYNFNLLWALPTHAITAFWLLKKRRPQWIRLYFLANTLLGIMLLALWAVLPQQLNIALIPVVALLAFRSYMIARK